MLRSLCTGPAALSAGDADRIENLSGSLQMIADLTGSDIFIDCLLPDRTAAVVVAQARPINEKSAYADQAVGKLAMPENEPAVFHAFETQMPVRDSKALTQENKTVRQDIVPVFGAEHRVIAVLIRESDISRRVMQEKKFEELARSRESSGSILNTLSPATAQQQAALREVHHRVKNNLQLVASILNMQARKCTDETTKKKFQENVGRVLSIAAIHDILTMKDCDPSVISSDVLMEKLCRNLHSLTPEGKSIGISSGGDVLQLDADTATSVSLVVSELVINALEHAFEGRERGRVVITTLAGNLYSSVSVEDNGVGFDPAASRKGSLGLDIVGMTVKEKLHGALHISSGSQGTKVLFDFKLNLSDA